MDLSTLQIYSLSEVFSDITYKTGIDESEIPGHKVIQSSSSEYLRKILKEKPNVKTINLPKPILPLTQELKADPTAKLISFTYKEANLQNLLDGGFGRDNCLTYYSIANSLKMTQTEKLILGYVNENLMNKDNAAQFYLEASKFGNEEWRDKALDLIAKNFDEIVKNKKDYDNILDLPFESFKSLIKREDLYVKSEDPLLEMVLRYVKEREECPVNPRDMEEKNLLAMAIGKAVEGEEEEENKKEEEDRNARGRGRGGRDRGGRGQQQQEEKKEEEKEDEPNEKEDFEKQAQLRIQRFKLNEKEIKELLLLLRYKFISHEEILKASKEKVMEPFREVLMEGLSAKLKTFEDVTTNYSISMEPRTNYMNARILSSAQFQEKEKNEKMQNYAKLFKNNAQNQKGGKGNQGFLKSNRGGAKKKLKRAQRTLANSRRLQPGQNFQDPMNNFSDFNQGGSKLKNIVTSKLQNSGLYNQYNSQAPQFNNPDAQFANFNNKNQPFPGGPQGFNRQFNVESDPDNIDDEDDEIEFRYNYDFDENGALYYLGTKGHTQNYVNPYTLSQVKVYFSSMGRGSYEDFVGRSLVNCRTLNEPNAFMGIDFGPERYLIPSCYTIKNRDSTRHVLLNWIFEGSRDFRTWFILDKRIHKTQDPHYNSSMERERGMLEKRGASTTWSIDQNYLKMAARSISLHSTDFNGFRFFRIKQISKNSSGSDNLALSGFEIYGIAKGRGWVVNDYE